MFEKDEGGVGWCGARIIREEEALGEVSGWLKNNISLNNHCDSREYTRG